MLYTFLSCAISLKLHFIFCLCEGTHWVAEVIENIPGAGITLTYPIEWGDISKLEELKTVAKRRVIPTHLSYEMTPVSVKQKKCKVSPELSVRPWE